MFRINLPGNKKVKMVILLVLILIAIGVLVSQRIENKKLIKEQQEIKEQVEKEEKEKQEKIQREEEEKLAKQKEEEQKLEEKVQKAKDEFFSKNYKNAIEIATEVINENPSMYSAYNIRGITKAYNGSFDDGMKDIDKALEIEPDFGYARFNKALNYELYERFEEALVWYDKALEVEQGAWTYYGIASIYGRRGDVENTVLYLSKAIEVDKSVIEYAKTEHDFNPVRNSEKFNELIK